jgi:hemerythrin-like domain-containing protein
VSRAIEVLMGEHRLIEQVLGSLESCATAVEEGLALQRKVVADYATFFRGFADACHHGKEEDILFERMMGRGLPRETGPLAVMFAEHRAGRQHVSALRGVAEGEGSLCAPLESQVVMENAADFVLLLRTHIQKEDRILYPMALRLLTSPELDAMEAEFEAFDRQMKGDGGYDRLRDLAAALCREFAPDPARMAAAAGLLACGSAR